MRAAVGVPEFEDADEFGLAIGEFGMRMVGGGALVGGTFARILDAEEGGDGQHLVEAAVRLRSDQHARQFHVDRQTRHLLADRVLALGGDRADSCSCCQHRRSRAIRCAETEISIRPSPATTSAGSPASAARRISGPYTRRARNPLRVDAMRCRARSSAKALALIGAA